MNDRSLARVISVRDMTLGLPFAALVLAIVPANAQLVALRPSANETDVHLVVQSPDSATVRVQRDIRYSAPNGSARQLDVFLPRSADNARLPVVLFANSGSPSMRRNVPYIEWARLVTSRGFAAVLYDSTIPTADSDIRKVLDFISCCGESLGIDSSRIVMWASSSNASVATPVALDARYRGINGYVLYYGAGDVHEPRLDVPIFVARSGLDQPGLNERLDSLSSKLTLAGAPVTLVNYPAGRHGFDWYDRTQTSSMIISQTLSFMTAVTERDYRREIVDGVVDARAASAVMGRRWEEAALLLEQLQTKRPRDANVALRLGHARAGAGQFKLALQSFELARDFGATGAFDVGVPATRAALRAGDRATALKWLRWTLSSMPPALAKRLEADEEIAPLLADPNLSNSTSR